MRFRYWSSGICFIRSETMSAVNITNVTVLDNPAAFLNPFQFEISYECLIPLADGTDPFRLIIFCIFDFCLLWRIFILIWFAVMKWNSTYLWLIALVPQLFVAWSSYVYIIVLSAQFAAVHWMVRKWIDDSSVPQFQNN